MIRVCYNYVTAFSGFTTASWIQINLITQDSWTSPTLHDYITHGTWIIDELLTDWLIRSEAPSTKMSLGQTFMEDGDNYNIFQKKSEKEILILND